MTNTNLDKHPSVCYAINGCQPKAKRIIAIRRGETGFYETTFNTAGASDEEVQKLVDSLNDELGVTRKMKAAMVWGSLYGFDTPGADPEKYSEEGQPVFKSNQSLH